MVEHAAFGEMVVVILERFLRIQRVLGQRIRAGRRCCPRIDERRLNHVVALVRSPDEAAAVVDGDVDLRILVNRAREVAKLAEHDVVRDDGIHLDAVDAAGAEHQRRQQIPAAPGTDDERGEADRSLHQVERQPGELVFQVFDLRQIAVEADDRRRGGRVDVHEARLGLLALVERAERPVAVRPVVHGHARERIPLREQHRVLVVPLRVADVERRRSRSTATRQVSPPPARRSPPCAPSSWPARRAAPRRRRAPRRAARRPARRSGSAAAAAAGSPPRRRSGLRRRRCSPAS